ncbi:hypothetical protein [Corallococcus sp. CA053C]|uniref:hypothetical protein n=1 Tax=Corallococcus sp. CA053C TaxID=2316732 RepID=UPI0018F30388|nr:hypothetical protein [Corallococcus sp. CA053C]
MSEDITVNVLIADAWLECIDGVVSGLRAAGLRDITVLAEVGLVQGVAREDALANLEQVPGVSAVERSREVRVLPPGSEPR